MAMTVDNEKTTVEIIPQPLPGDIKDLILAIRGEQVLLDSDVAMLYGYETKAINQAASRNKKRFPPEFRFQLTDEEMEIVSRSQIVTLNAGRGSNIKYRPYVYTEMGIGMLSGILKNDTAVQVSIGIMKAFVEMRRILSTNRYVFERISDIDKKLMEHDSRFDEVFDLLQKPETFKQCVFYKGEFYDAFQLVLGFVRQAKASITVIDSYADGSVLEILAEKKPNVTLAIVTANPGKIPQQHITRFTAQHGQPKIVQNTDFHDRFVIVDDIDVYVFGASIKDLGNRCFGVFKLEDADDFLGHVKTVIV